MKVSRCKRFLASSARLDTAFASSRTMIRQNPDCLNRLGLPPRTSHRGAAHRAIASRKVQPATGLRHPTGWAVVNQPPGKHDRCPIPCLPTREIDGGPTPGALRSDDTDAPSGVAYDPMSPGSAFIL